MDHQPYETWIFEKTDLAGPELTVLHQHLQECPRCRQLQEAWEKLTVQMHPAALVSPAAGFSQRWRESLPKRRARQQARQIRRFFLALCLANLLSLLVLTGFIVSASAPIDWMVSILQAATRLIITLSHAQEVLLSWLRVIPPVIPILIWAMLAGSVCLLTSIWALSLWRISSKGVL